ncbi:1138_t:CDS:2 [Acaulospora colombiana]|uniref:1138_t:CDS:1 n=1 Tax=Acaulospora colombiana TaxID=27376 RepID=A0ACA9LRA6_9GLOM|nr:1138_t:CDS:2 [Acaulospora colombiana]
MCILLDLTVAEWKTNICYLLFWRIPPSLLLSKYAPIYQVKCSPQINIEEPRKAYEKALGDISRYLEEIDKPGKFNAKAMKWFKELASADKIADVNKKLLQNFTDATMDFYNSIILDTNNKIRDVDDKITEMKDDMKDMADDLKAFIEIMLLQKGGDDDLTDEAIESLKINPFLFEDDDDNENKVTRNNIRKRVYIGNEVAVKKLPSSDLDIEKKKIEKIAKIINLLGCCDYIEKF